MEKGFRILGQRGLDSGPLNFWGYFVDMWVCDSRQRSFFGAS